MSVEKVLPTVTECETGAQDACGNHPISQQAYYDAGAIVLGMRFAALRYRLDDPSVP